MTKAKTLRWWALVAVLGLALGTSVACGTNDQEYPTQPPARNVGDTLIGDDSLIANFEVDAPEDPTDRSRIFIDTSLGFILKWKWDFGDGKTSSFQNPVHTYNKDGTYVVLLTVSNSDTSDSVTQFVTIGEIEEPPPEGQPPLASFSFTANNETLTVIFVDTSSGPPTSWAWSFGDGTGSNAKDPIKTYSSAGTYLVTLTVTNSAGSDSSASFVTIGTASGED